MIYNDDIKIISVGNIAMGGTGKTPHTLMIAEEFIKQGEKVAILSLGYKGRLGYGINVISDGDGNILKEPPYAADEPYMMAKNYPEVIVITGKKRENALKIAKEKYGATVVILDDGFQYKKLKRHVNILLMDHSRPISTGYMFPFGYLREFPSAIKRSDIILFTRSANENIPKDVKCYIDNQPLFFSKTSFHRVIYKNEDIDIKYFKDAKVAAYSAIAGNQSFASTLTNFGMDLKFFTSFKDHSILSIDTIEDIVSSGKTKGATVFLTTEKDFVKIPKEYQNIFGYVKLDIQMENKVNFITTINRIAEEKILNNKK